MSFHDHVMTAALCSYSCCVQLSTTTRNVLALKSASMAGLRSKIEAGFKEVAKLLRANCRSLDVSAFNSPDVETTVANFEDFIYDVWNVTQRVSPCLLRNACADAFPKSSKAEQRLFGSQLSDAFKFCKDKSYQFSSGVKLTKPVCRIAKLMKNVRGDSRG